MRRRVVELEPSRELMPRMSTFQRYMVRGTLRARELEVVGGDVAPRLCSGLPVMEDHCREIRSVRVRRVGYGIASSCNTCCAQRLARERHENEIDVDAIKHFGRAPFGWRVLG